MIYNLTPDTEPDSEVERVHEYLAHNHGPANTLVARVDGQILAAVGNNIGTDELHSLQLLEDASTVPDQSEEPANDTSSPYPADTDPALLPLFEAPEEWFSDVEVNLSAGGLGRITSLSPDGIQFSKYTVIRDHDQYDYYSDLADRFESNHQVQDAIVVENKSEAHEQAQQYTNRATWINYIPRDEITIHEYVAFNSSVTTQCGLVKELSQVLSHPPDFVDLFEATTQVAHKELLPSTNE